MSRFKTQLINDYRLNKKQIFSPMIVFLIIDLVAIISFLIFKANAGLEYSDIITMDIQVDDPGITSIADSFWYLIGMGILGFAGFVQVLVALSLGNQALNLEKNQKCEIFYRSQPVSVWDYSLSKYIITIAGPIVILFIIGIINLVLVIPFISQIVKFNFLDAVSGLSVSFLLYSRSILVLGSLAFLMSAIFKEKAFMKLVLITVSLQLIIVFAHFSMDTPLLDLFGFIGKLINPLQGLKNMIDFNHMETVLDFRQAFTMKVLLFNWHSALQVLASGVFFVLGVFIYSRKEIN